MSTTGGCLEKAGRAGTGDAKGGRDALPISLPGSVPAQRVLSLLLRFLDRRFLRTTIRSCSFRKAERRSARHLFLLFPPTLIGTGPANLPGSVQWLPDGDSTKPAAHLLNLGTLKRRDFCCGCTWFFLRTGPCIYSPTRPLGAIHFSVLDPSPATCCRQETGREAESVSDRRTRSEPWEHIAAVCQPVPRRPDCSSCIAFCLPFHRYSGPTTRPSLQRSAPACSFFVSFRC